MRFAPALRFFRRNSPSVHEPEPADMGTAFGMEASLGDTDYSDFRRSDYALESETSQRAAAESPLSWLSSRRSP